MMLRVGFPRALFYYLYFPFWHTFFTQLGLEVVCSEPTNKLSLDLGVKETVNDACLPIKIYHGHVAELKDKVDVLFLPRMVSVRRLESEVFCPKFLGLPDMVRNSIEGLPLIIDDKVDLNRGIYPLWRLCLRIARKLGKRGIVVENAFFKAKAAQRKFTAALARGVPTQEAIDTITGQNTYEKGHACAETHEPDVHLAILGYPYLIYDSYINVGLLEKLAQMGIKAWTVEMIPPEQLDREARNLPKNLFWYFSNRTMRAMYYYLKKQEIDGIVHVTAFGCGPDAMVDKLMELEAKAYQRKPFLTLSLDEHTGEAGVLTRIEAFVDMLRLRRSENENLVSHHG